MPAPDEPIDAQVGRRSENLQRDETASRDDYGASSAPMVIWAGAQSSMWWMDVAARLILSCGGSVKVVVCEPWSDYAAQACGLELLRMANLA